MSYFKEMKKYVGCYNTDGIYPNLNVLGVKHGEKMQSGEAKEPDLAA